jgi:hypothetical protein
MKGPETMFHDCVGYASLEGVNKYAAATVSRVALLCRPAAAAACRVKRVEADMAPAAIGRPVGPSADPWHCVPDTDQRPEHWALWALRWIEPLP